MSVRDAEGSQGAVRRAVVRPTGSVRRAVYPVVGVVVGLVAGLLGIEVLLQVLTNRNAYTYVWPPNMETTFMPVAGSMPGVTGPSQFKINSQGIRGPEMPRDREAAYRVLAIGGSTTECLYLDQSKAWPHLLGVRLGSTADGRKVWVGNIGKSGTNTRHHILAMERVVPQYGIDVAVVLIGINDFGLRIAQGAEYDPHFLERQENHLSLLETGFAVFSEPGPGVPLYKRSRLWAVAGSVRRELHARSGAGQEQRGSFYVKARAYRKSGRILAQLPDLAPGLDEYERNITKLVELGTTQSVRMLFLTQPVLWRPGLTPPETDMLWLGGVGRFTEGSGHAYYSPEALARGMDAYNARLLSVCERLGLECVDLNRAIPRNLTMFHDDAHFTDRGAERVAEVVAAYLASRPPFARSEASVGSSRRPQR